jgi:predicted ATPase
MAEAISLAKELKDMHGLAVALYFAALLAYHERDPAEVERLALGLMEFSTLQNFGLFRIIGTVYRGWARSASGHPAEGISWIQGGIEDYQATGSALHLPLFLALKAEALNVADRPAEALEAITEAEVLAERIQGRWWSAEMHRLRAVFLATLGADRNQIEASFREAIRIAKEQKSVSLEKRAEVSCAE